MNINNRTLLDAAASGMTVAELLDQLMESTDARAQLVTERRATREAAEPKAWGGFRESSVPASTLSSNVEPSNAAPKATGGSGRRIGARTGYEVARGRRGAEPPLPADGLRPNDARVWAVFTKHKGNTLLTAKEVMQRSGMRQKPVESSIYSLRTLGLIRSVIIDPADRD